MYLSLVATELKTVSSLLMLLLQGPRRQPKGFTKNQVLATAVDPRTKNLYGVPEEEWEEVWDLVTTELVILMTEEHAASEEQRIKAVGEAAAAAATGAAKAAAAAAARATVAAAAAAAGTVAGGESAGGGGRARKKRCISGFMSQSTSAPPPQQPPAQHQQMSANGRFTAVALQEIGAFKLKNRLPIDVDGPASNPLLWWKMHAADFPQLAKLARRVLCIPATSAPSERIFSVAGQIATQKRNRLASENVALLVYLRNAWPPAAAWRKVHPDNPEGRGPRASLLRLPACSS